MGEPSINATAVAMNSASARECCANDSVFGREDNATITEVVGGPSTEVDGYTLPVRGLDNGNFVLIHGVATTCLIISLIAAVTTILFTVGSSNKWKVHKFYSWSTGDRMLVYMATMDGTFNIAHMMDHGMYWYQRDHVRPPQLCAFFGFVLSVFVIAQNVLVFYVALRTCIMVFRMRSQSFGLWDWQPMVLSFCPGILASAIFWCLGLLGPSGAFCYLDPVKAPGVLVIFTTAFLVAIGCSNMCLYTITVWQLWTTDRMNRKHLGCENTQLRQSLVKTAWTCSYFILSFFAQWLPIIVYGAYNLATNEAPFELFMAVTTFTNLGGLFNLFIYVLLRYKKRRARQLTRKNAVRGRPAGARSLRQPRPASTSTGYMNMPPASPPSPHGAVVPRLSRAAVDNVESDALISCSTSVNNGVRTESAM